MQTIYRDRFSSIVDLMTELLAAPTTLSTWDFSKNKSCFVYADCSDITTEKIVDEVCALLKQKGFYVAKHHNGIATPVHGITIVKPPLICIWDEYPKLHMHEKSDIILIKNKPTQQNASEIQKVMDDVDISTIDKTELVKQMAFFDKIMLHNCYFFSYRKNLKKYREEKVRTQNVRKTLLKIWSETTPIFLHCSKIC